MSTVTLPFPRHATRRWHLADLRLASVCPALPAQILQERLSAHGFPSAPEASRRLDRATVAAVERFQAARHLRVDGIPGPITCDALLAPAVAG